ncbi:MAG: alpha-hydroxy-acid oxidizing protein [Erysipelotrichaceae bacterium]|nr:alpha-hydroxy-acid oxidizing protein [Erysipelotrichaceae bacterium]
MELKEVFEQSKLHQKTCYVCPVCNGVACKGQIPGMGGKGTGASFIRNYQKIHDVKLVLDTIMEDSEISTESYFFDTKVSLPVYGAPIAGMIQQYQSDFSETDFADAMVEGCLLAGTISFVGDGKDVTTFVDPLRSVEKNQGMGVPTMKPWERKGIDARLEHVRVSNCLALACDVDASGLLFLRNVDPRITNFSVSDIRYVKEKANKPLIIKGIMSVKGALKALEAGADGIVVSNHGGRVLDDTLATIEVLEEICDAVKGKMKVFVDGGFRSGVDVFKALALGADGVLIGRPMAIAALGNRKDGVSEYLKKIQIELKETMMMTGCHTIADITKDKIICK